jgi:hypothetical protein
MGLVLQLGQRPLQKFSLGAGVEVVALVVEAVGQGVRSIRRVARHQVQRLAFLGKADAGRVDRLAATLGPLEALSLDQRDGHVDLLEVLFVVRALGFDLLAQGIEVVVGDVGARTIGPAQCGQHLGRGQVVVGGQLGGGGVAVQLGWRRRQYVVAAVHLL